ncbi:MAG: nucleotide exchange factor GrpE [Acidobacteria bacterium]|nr:nucleotide exchange factor GrpE [Acidobacteriota bacterium]
MAEEIMEQVEPSVQPEPNQPEASTSAPAPLAELEQLEQELEATRDQLLRTLADFDNYRRRIEREAHSIGQSGKRDLLLGVLDVMDSFDQAFALSPDEAAAVEGFRAIRRQLLNLLESHGVTPFESSGKPFDPEWHEAIGTVSAEEIGVTAGTIVQEFQKGYSWGGKLLRPARVQVAK